MKRGMFVLVLVALLLVACGPASSEYNTSQAVENQQKVYTTNQPIPAFEWSLERDVFIQLYSLRNEAVSTYTVVSSQMGVTIFECPSIGYPLAADYQLTNPVAPYRYSDGNISSTGAVVEQPEPNGLFSSKNTAGTWVMCVQSDGKIYPVYTELNATTFPMMMRVNAEGQYEPTGLTETVIDVSR
jgi:hypothetical protein